MIQYTVFSIGGKLGEEALFSDFSDRIFFNDVGNWLDLGWGGRHRGAAPISVPLLLCWPHSAFPSGCWETSQLKVCPVPSGRGDSVIFESPAASLGSPGRAVLLCSGLYPHEPHTCHTALSLRAPAGHWHPPPSQSVSPVPSLPPATMPSSPWLLRVSGGAHTAWVATVASLPWV